MPRVAPLDLDDLAARHAPLFETLSASYGALPASFLTLGRHSDLLDAAARLALAAMGPGRVSQELKWLVAHVASRASGCRYCSAHTGFHAHHTAGAALDKVEAIWEFEASELFSDAERAALRVARAAAVVPNEATDDHFDELRRHFDDDEIVEIIAPVAAFGFFNRWNDTLASDLEPEPSAFASRHVHPDPASRPSSPSDGRRRPTDAATGPTGRDLPSSPNPPSDGRR